MKLELIPVILAKNPADFKKKFAVIKTLRPKPRWVQIDVVDGKFAPWKTWPLTPPLSHGEREINKKPSPRGRGQGEGFNVEVDLMVVDPIEQAKKWIKAGAKRVLIHTEVIKQSPLLFKEGLGVVKKNVNIEIGLSLNAQTPLSHLTPYIKYADCVLLLGVNPGKSGQLFQLRVLKKIRALRKKYPALPIEVDGGVNLKNAAQILKAGATRLAVASAIHQASDPQKAYQQFLKVVHQFNKNNFVVS